ncbi:hypothetical protein NBRC111894_2453 [Sporolactobacillus inulinus]|uniref:Long-chain-fatty-acid--CoA ligase n=1 Tax=Sporolactobacillus inulinus TaxID=2078 RepID=A0A4Y1ZCZ2_9BACL|nr:hypothetical protein NBRC111894_2453 [Sporolactobacillus inulinus]
MNLFDEMVKQAKLHPKKVIIEDTQNKFTYKKFLIAANIMSKKIREVVDDEKRIGLFLPNVVPQAIVLFALFKMSSSRAC